MSRQFKMNTNLSVENSTVAQRQVMKFPKFNPGNGNESRLVYLVGGIDEDSINDVQQQLLDLSSINKNPIHLVISTLGGSVHEMFSLYDVMKFIPAPVYTVGLGKVMSAGSLILAAGEKGHRMVGKSTRIMIHSFSAGFHGNIFELRNELDEINRLQDMYVSLMVEETNMTKIQVSDMLQEILDRTISASQAIELGIVDKIL